MCVHMCAHVCLCVREIVCECVCVCVCVTCGLPPTWHSTTAGAKRNTTSSQFSLMRG